MLRAALGYRAARVGLRAGRTENSAVLSDLNGRKMKTDEYSTFRSDSPVSGGKMSAQRKAKFFDAP